AASAGAATDEPEPSGVAAATPGADGSETAELQRVEAEQAAAAARPPAASFDAAVEELVELGVTLWESLERDDQDAASAANESAERLLADLKVDFPAAGELALDRRLRAVPTTAAVRDTVRRHVLERILRDALELRHASLAGESDRSRLDTLVGAMLDCLPQHAELADALGRGLLAGKPYLGSAHESAVLELAEL